jgi:hypothetical protein
MAKKKIKKIISIVKQPGEKDRVEIRQSSAMAAQVPPVKPVGKQAIRVTPKFKPLT